NTANTTTISDNESATLAIAATSSVAEQGAAQSVGVVTLTITGIGSGTFPLGAGIVLTANETDGGGSAVSGTDYAAFGTQAISFNNSAGADGAITSGATRSASLTPTNDRLLERAETLNLSLSTLGAGGTATMFGNQANVTT